MQIINAKPINKNDNINKEDNKWYDILYETINLLRTLVDERRLRIFTYTFLSKSFENTKF